MTPSQTLARRLMLATAALLLAATTAHAADRPAADPVDAVKASTARVQAIVTAATDQPKMVAEIRTEMASLVDYHAFAKRTLKKGWPSLTPAQRDQFVASFKQLLMNTYAKRFKPGSTFRMEVRGTTTFGGSSVATAKVLTTLHGDKAAADVDYLFHALKGPDGVLAWRGVDIVIDEASMALGWRKRFQKVLDKDGFDALIKKIDARAKKVAQ